MRHTAQLRLILATGMVLLTLPAPPGALASGPTDVLCGRVQADVGCQTWTTDARAAATGSEVPGVVAWSADGSRAYVATEYHYATLAVYSYDAQTGGLDWTSIGPFGWPAVGLVVRGADVYAAGGNGGSVLALDAASGVARWNRTSLGALDALTASADGATVFVAGTASSVCCTSDLLVTALDAATGATRWRLTLDGPGHGPDAANQMAVSPDGARLYVVGDSWGAGSYEDHVALALDAASGSVVWQTRINTPLNDRETGARLALSADGARLMVAGTTKGQMTSSWDSEGRDYHVALLDAADGRVLTTERVDGGSGYLSDEVRDVTYGGGRFFVTGTIRAFSNPCCIGLYDALTLAYDAQTGARLWTQQFGSRDPNGYVTNEDDDARSIAAAPDGATVYVAMDHKGWWSVLAYDAATGAPHWRLVHEVNGYWSTLTVASISPDGSRVLLVGPDTDSSSSYTDHVHAALFGTSWPDGPFVPNPPGGVS